MNLLWLLIVSQLPAPPPVSLVIPPPYASLPQEQLQLLASPSIPFLYQLAAKQGIHHPVVLVINAEPQEMEMVDEAFAKDKAPQIYLNRSA
nr:hypothetical protein Iba_chr13aCG11860 [Ipomoea batatas]